jgi:hypothetical protein
MSSAANEGDWFGGLFHCLEKGAFAAPKKALPRDPIVKIANLLPRFHF